MKPTPKIPGLPPPITATALMADTTITKPPELVSGLLHQGTKGVIASVSKAGKTWLLLDLALSVATGSNFLGKPTTQGKVLFINFELQAAFIKDRLAVLKKRRNVEPGDNLVIWNLRGKTADFEALVLNIAREVEGQGYTLIIFDPIYKAMVGKAEGVGSNFSLLCNQLERLAERSGAAVVFSHHFPKGNMKKRSVIDRMAGSGVLARDADTIVTLTQHETPDCFTVEMVLRNLPHQPAFVVQFDYPVMVERDDLDPEDVTVADVEDEDDHGILELIRVRPQTSGEWLVKAYALGLSRPTFYRIKRKLQDEGIVAFDFKTKTWSLVKAARTVKVETGETGETAETPGTGRTS